MNRCFKCGTENDNDALFCAECGNKLAGRTNNSFPQTTIPTVNFNANNAAYNNKPKSHTGLIITLIVIIAVMVVALINILIFTDVINGTNDSLLEKYEHSIKSVFSNEEEYDWEKYLSDETESSTTTEYTQAETTSSYNPDNDPNLQVSTTESTTEDNHLYRVNVGKSVLNLRSDKTTKSKILKTIPNNTELIITNIEDGWGYTTYSGKTGWVSMEYVDKV